MGMTTVIKSKLWEFPRFGNDYSVKIVGIKTPMNLGMDDYKVKN